MKAVARKKVTRSHGAAHRPSAEDLFHAPGEAPAVHSITRTVSLTAAVSGTAFTAAMVQAVEGVRDWAVDHRCLVGHIKVFVEIAGPQHLWLASTGKRIQVQVSEGWDRAASREFQVNFTAIIFATGQESLREVVEARLGGALATLLS